MVLEPMTATSSSIEGEERDDVVDDQQHRSCHDDDVVHGWLLDGGFRSVPSSSGNVTGVLIREG
jgi:hypothetical protein